MISPPRPPFRITIIGCGKMGSALLKGWLANNLVAQATVVDPHPLPPEISAIKRITHLTAYDGSPIDSDVLLLAIKPQNLDEACKALKPQIRKNTIILSIIAGKSLKTLGSLFPEDQPIIRAMPNTPASIGKGMTVACANNAAEKPHQHVVKTLLQANGKCEWVRDENLMNTITAVSGSGPAYVYYFIECLAQAGEKLGLEETLAQTLARQTVIGSAALAESSKDTAIDILRKNVTSPGGTTEAALKILMDGNFEKIIDEALKAAQTRGEELNKAG